MLTTANRTLTVRPASTEIGCDVEEFAGNKTNALQSSGYARQGQTRLVLFPAQGMTSLLIP